MEVTREDVEAWCDAHPFEFDQLVAARANPEVSTHTLLHSLSGFGFLDFFPTCSWQPQLFLSANLQLVVLSSSQVSVLSFLLFFFGGGSLQAVKRWHERHISQANTPGRPSSAPEFLMSNLKMPSELKVAVDPTIISRVSRLVHRNAPGSRSSAKLCSMVSVQHCTRWLTLLKRYC